MTRLSVEQGSGEDSREWGIMARASQLVDNFGWLLACLLLLLIGMAAIAQSALKAFWWDELASLDIARLPHLADVWSFFRAGLDTPSPVPTLIVWCTTRLTGGSEALARVAFEAGFLLMCLCLFSIVARRYSSGYALGALLLPAISGTFYYASELRTYGIVLGAVALAIYCWQSADNVGLKRMIAIAGIFAALDVAILCHLFAIFVLIPFGVAQLVRDRLWDSHHRRVDWAVWMALVLAPVGLLALMPGMAAAHRTYAGAFWSKPHSGEILFSYSYALGVGWMIAVLLVLMAWPALERRFGLLSLAESEEVGDGFQAAEWTLFAGLALLPFFAWPLSHFVGVYVPRYVLPLTIGVVLIVVGGVAEALKRNRAAGVALATAFLLVFVHDKLPLVNQARHMKQSLPAVFARQPMVQMLAESGLPIVAPNTVVYTQLQHYLPGDVEKRLIYTLNTPEAIRPEEDRDAELSMKLFATRLPLRVEEFASFASEHPRFLVVVKNGLAQGGVTGRLDVRWIGGYGSGVAWGLGPYSVYEVEVRGRD